MQCYGCTHYVRESIEYGQMEQPECKRVGIVMDVMEDGEAAEQITMLFEAMAFKLSELNNCPFYEEKHKAAQRQALYSFVNN